MICGERTKAGTCLRNSGHKGKHNVYGEATKTTRKLGKYHRKFTHPSAR